MADEPLVSLEHAWRRLMTVLGFVNPGRARSSGRALRAIHHLMRNG